MRLAELVQTSTDVASVGGRLDKIARMADLLARLGEDEVEIAVAFLSGSTRQGRIGVGHAAITAGSDVVPADAPVLDLRDVDAAFEALSTMSGKGSGAARAQALRALFS